MANDSTKSETANSNQTVTIELQNNFYRDGFKIIKLSISLMLVAIVILVIISMYFFVHQILPINFTVQDDFKVQTEISLQQKYKSVTDLLQWVSGATPELLSTDFAHYEQILERNKRYFTLNGWAKYQEVLKVFLNHDEIIKNKYFVAAKSFAAPVILNQGIINDQYGWWIQFPMTINYVSALQNINSDSMQINNTKNNLNVQILVVRTSIKENLEGIKIENIIIKRA